MFTGDMSWYTAYTERHEADGIEAWLSQCLSIMVRGRCGKCIRMEAEVVLCTAGTLSLTQKLPEGEVTTVLQAGQYIVNPPGVWHTANEDTAGTAVFITLVLAPNTDPGDGRVTTVRPDEDCERWRVRYELVGRHHVPAAAR